MQELFNGIDWSGFWPGLIATALGAFLGFALTLLGQSILVGIRNRQRKKNLRKLLLSNVKKQRKLAGELLALGSWPGNLLETFDTTTLAVAARDHYYVADDIKLLEKIDEFRIHLESVDRYYLKRILPLSVSNEGNEFINYRNEKLPAELRKAIRLANQITRQLGRKS